jgi:diacylglycerol kinase family enzyme
MTTGHSASLAVAADILLRRPAHRGTYRVRFTELRMTLDQEQPWELDGEVMGPTWRLTVVAQPGGLLLRVPPELV